MDGFEVGFRKIADLVVAEPLLLERLVDAAKTVRNG